MKAHELYKQLDTPDGLERCPCCNQPPALWQYSKSPTDSTSKVVMCSYGEVIGPQDGAINDGCLLYMPPDDFYQPTIREAVRFWNEYAKALRTLRGKA